MKAVAVSLNSRAFLGKIQNFIATCTIYIEIFFLSNPNDDNFVVTINFTISYRPWLRL